MRNYILNACLIAGLSVCIAVPLSAAPKGVGNVLTAAAPDLVPIPSRMKQGTVSVKNAGKAAAGASIVTVVCKKKGFKGSCAEHPSMERYTNPAYPNALVIQVPAINPGHVYNFKLPFWGDLVWVPGKYSFTMKADAASVVPESNEGNNKKSAKVSLP